MARRIRGRAASFLALLVLLLLAGAAEAAEGGSRRPSVSGGGRPEGSSYSPQRPDAGEGGGGSAYSAQVDIDDSGRGSAYAAQVDVDDGPPGRPEGRPRSGSASGGAPPARQCPAVRAQPTVVSPLHSLPNRVLRNRNRTIVPLVYFDTGKELGAGAFGRVLLGSLRGVRPGPLDEAEGSQMRLFAIKEQSFSLWPKCGDDPKPCVVRRASRTEPQFMKALDGGPYMIKFWGSWTSRAPLGKNTPFKITFSIAMAKAFSDLESELLGKGKFFRDPVRPGLPVDKARIMAGQLAIAIGFMHSKGIIHRDFKPGNVLLDAKRRPMVADFGCAIEASLVEQDSSEAGVCDYRISAPEAIVYYRNPDAPPYGLEVDWWSLGVTVFNLLTGTPQPEWNQQHNGPFLPQLKNQVDYSVFWGRAFRRGRVPAQREFLDAARMRGLPDDAEDFVSRLLDPDPRTRLGSYQAEGKKGWEAVMCHPFLASLDPNRLLAAGQRQASELNTRLSFTTPDGRPPDPRAARPPRGDTARALERASGDVEESYGNLLQDLHEEGGRGAVRAYTVPPPDDVLEGGVSGKPYTAPPPDEELDGGGGGGRGGGRGGERDEKMGEEDGKDGFGRSANPGRGREGKSGGQGSARGSQRGGSSGGGGSRGGRGG
ncbi:kinase-like domain-containing protein [Hyaloraphidium curvatum]|nr:kinase-like domain-containing protein [Hyaloraphidium curvatum]